MYAQYALHIQIHTDLLNNRYLFLRFFFNSNGASLLWFRVLYLDYQWFIIYKCYVNFNTWEYCQFRSCVNNKDHLYGSINNICYNKSRFLFYAGKTLNGGGTITNHFWVKIFSMEYVSLKFFSFSVLSLHETFRQSRFVCTHHYGLINILTRCLFCLNPICDFTPENNSNTLFCI